MHLFHTTFLSADICASQCPFCAMRHLRHLEDVLLLTCVIRAWSNNLIIFVWRLSGMCISTTRLTAIRQIQTNKKLADASDITLRMQIAHVRDQLVIFLSLKLFMRRLLIDLHLVEIYLLLWKLKNIKFGYTRIPPSAIPPTVLFLPVHHTGCYFTSTLHHYHIPQAQPQSFLYSSPAYLKWLRFKKLFCDWYIATLILGEFSVKMFSFVRHAVH